MSDPTALKTFALNASNANPDPFGGHRVSWFDLSLASGWPGVLLLFAQMQKQELLDVEAIIHQYVLKIKEALESNGLTNLSLFVGIAGICFAMGRVSMEGKRYQRMLNSLQEYLLERVNAAYLDPICHNIANRCSSSSTLHDLIQGICGIGRYALEHLFDTRFYVLAKKIMGVLVALSQPLIIKEKIVPGWFLSPSDPLNTVHHPSRYPHGNFNLGLAHGVPGILAVLSIAALRGVKTAGQEEAMCLFAEWIRERSFQSHGAPCWPYSISWEEETQKEKFGQERCKDAWCYGAPGVARSLFLAGKSLNDGNLKSFALDAFRGVFARSYQEWRLPGPNLCHGIGGLLLITHAMSKESGCEDLAVKCSELKELLLLQYNPNFPLGFKDIEPTRQGGQAAVSKPGLLEGDRWGSTGFNNPLRPSTPMANAFLD